MSSLSRRNLVVLVTAVFALLVGAVFIGNGGPGPRGGVQGLHTNQATQQETDAITADASGQVGGAGATSALNTGRIHSMAPLRGASVWADGSGGYSLDGFGSLHPLGSATTPHLSATWAGFDIARGLALRSDRTSGYVLDGFGGIHPVGGAPAPSLSAYWPNWDIARSLALRPDGTSGYVLDAFGGIHPFGGAPVLDQTAYWPNWDIARGMILTPDGSGGWVLDGYGGLHSFGSAHTVSQTGYWPGWDIARGVAMLPGSSDGGYVLDGFGGIHPFGSAPAIASPLYTANLDTARSLAVVSIVAAVPTPTPAPTPTPTPTPTQTPGPTPTPTPGSGITVFAYTGPNGPAATVASLPANVTGVSWIFPWNSIEPSPGVYDWSQIDAAVQAAAASGRTSMIRVIAGKNSPSWVQPQITMTFTAGGPTGTQTISMPRPWEPSYVSALTQFIAAYGSRYNGDSRIFAVEMTGGGWQGEMNLPQWSGWGAAGYSDAALIGAWDSIIDAYRASFPSTPTVLDLGEPLYNVGVVGFKSNVQAPVMQHAQSYGGAVFLQQNGLQASTTPGSTYGTILGSAASTTSVGWQMWGGANGPSVLHPAFTTAIATHARYVEVYLNDCVNPANAAEISYLARG